MSVTQINVEDLPKQYDHRQTERRWYDFWLEKRYFHAEPDAARKAYTIVIPPPNVTGALHLGHALNNSLQDILVRFKRMQGYNALWMPGTDHAGIATQAVVERRLLDEEKKTRHDVGREVLVERIWQWKREYEQRILGQLKRMGFSCDWERTRFTLDPVCARAVRHTFFRFFQERLIFRGKRLVNWDTFLQTAVSDDEVFHESIDGHFWHLKYPVIDPKPGEPAHVVVATTRPETMLGDTAVAVHPDPAKALAKAEKELRDKLAAAGDKDRAAVQAELDAVVERRGSMLPALEKLRDMARDGRKILLPLVNREIPLVADEWAKPELGSGCVKITPAHDANDYEVWRRNPEVGAINILNADGTLNANAGGYQGLTVPKARQKVVADLEAASLLDRVEDRKIEIAHSDRSKTAIEPFLADQWFVKMSDHDDGRPGLAQTAMDAVIDQRVKIVPSRYAKTYLDWLGEKRDWCIGRQLWWGHRIPIWYAPTASEADLKKAFAGRADVVWYRDDEHDQWLICSLEDDLPDDAIAGHTIRQDADVLDTWFSSALWPHSTLGWPEKTPELAYFYPTSALVTSRDIITLWVARMVLTGLFNVGDVPFREVFIHPKILDSYGEGMSKSKGNGVDPLDVMEKFGADALRFGLAYLTTETQDIRMSVEFECPHCGGMIEQTKKNRVLPRVPCKHCGKEFATQWAKTADDLALPRGAVVSERFELSRNFCNKLWNAARFAFLNLEGFTPATVSDEELTVEDRWILSRLTSVTEQATSALDEYRFADAARSLYEFAWDEFCSFYVEMVKSRLQDPARRAVAQRVLVHTLDTLVRLLHPITPFISEEIWQTLGQMAPERGLARVEPAAESVMIAAWPEPVAAWKDATIEAQFGLFRQALVALRDIRARQNILPRKAIRFSARCDESTAALIRPLAAYYESLAGATATDLGPTVEPPAVCASATLAGIELYVDLAGLIDVASEMQKQAKERDNLHKLIHAKRGKLANASFVSRAPADVVARERQGLADLEQQLAAVERVLDSLGKQQP